MHIELPALAPSSTLGMIYEYITMKVGIFTIVTSTILAAGSLYFLNFALNYRRSQEFPLANHRHLQIPIHLLPDNTTKTHFIHPPLRARGRDIVDARDQRLKLASVNWYGASDEQFIPGGLDVRHRSDIAKVIKRLGFNSVRLPYSDEMVVYNPLIPAYLLEANKDLIGSRALEVFTAVVTALTDEGIGVVVNNHITQATWCCGANPCDAAWSNNQFGPLCRVSQTEDQWIENWVTIMTPLVNNSLVIGADLRNEVRGLWGTMTWDMWATAAERAGNRLLGICDDWLIIVGGTSSSNDLSGVRDRPIVLHVPDRVVYEAHVYSWSGWGSLGGMYARRSYKSFVKSMRENWAYLLEDNIAPVWVGEFGCPHSPNNGDLHYWMNLVKYLKEVDADFGYWAINPRKPHGDSEETYGLVKDDWETPVLDYRLRDMLQLMR
jgi:aryl-phospho-beta-D-glucosidase BglC (GH1 family)